jgi:hypothetical protein
VIAGVDGKLRRLAGNSGKTEGSESEFGKLFPLPVATPSGLLTFTAMVSRSASMQLVRFSRAFSTAPIRATSVSSTLSDYAA